MILHVTDVRPLPGYQLWLRFDDGAEGYADLSGELWGPVFEPLKAPELFATARVDDVLRTVTWANGADFAPEFLRGLLVGEKAA